MKKLFILMFCMIFLVGIGSAFEIDDVKYYDETTATYTLENFFGFGKKIADIELKTSQIFEVPRGYQKAAEIEIRNGEFDYEEIINGMELYDIRNGMKEVVREIDYKYKIIIQVPEYKTVCDKDFLANGTSININCREEQVGLKDEVKWLNFTKNSLLKGENITLGIFTDVQKGDKIEWVLNVYGNEKLTKWAEWSESMNVGLTNAWNHNETSGLNAEDQGGVIFTSQLNLTYVGNPNFVPGLIGNGIFLEGSGDFGATSSPISGFTGTGDFAISLWINATADNSGTIVGLNNVNQRVTFVNLNRGIFIVLGGRTTGELPNPLSRDGSTWNHLIIQRNSGRLIVYQNGTLNYNDTMTGSIPSLDFTIGTDGTNDFLGGIDEVVFWNRSLSQSEITDLYNNGNGITFTDAFERVTTDLIIPINAFNTTSDTIEFSANSTPSVVSLTNVTLYIWYNNNSLFLNNFTSLSGTTPVTTNWTISSIPDGNYIWNALTKGTSNTSDWGINRTFSIDTTNPSVSVSSPTGDQGTFVSGRNLTLTWNVSDTNLATCFYDYGGSNTTVTCSDNSTNLTVTSSALISLIFYANDTFGHINSSSTNWSYSFIEQNVTFNVNVSETSSQDFTLNLTTSVNILSISSILNYDGTEDISTASCDGNNCSLFNNIDIPLISSGESELKSFFWNFTIFNGTDSINIATSTRNQNVSKIHLEICNATFTTQTLNFTTFDEQNLSRISPYIFDGTFDFWIGSGTVMRNNSFSDNVTEINLCLSPNETMKTDATINYDEDGNNSIYTDRFYYFDDQQISNISQDINMYLLKSIASTSFILKVQDENLLPIADALIEIHRFYPGEGIFRIVQIAKTDDNGKSIGFFETETVDYKFIIKKAGVTLLETGQQKVIPETSPFTLTFNTGIDLGEPWASQNDIPNLNSTLTWNSNTGIVTYIYIDTSTNFTQARLLVQEQSLVNSTAYITICNDTSSLSSATITCNVGNSSGFYIAGAFITRAGETLDRQITFQIETFSSVVGLTGLFMGFFLLVIASFMFKFNEVAGIWGLTLTVFFINLMGLIKFGAVFVTAILGIAIILTWVMEK